MKKFIHKIVDAPKLIKRIWILLWVILIILLVMKFCFGIWYPIVVKNETFVKICSFIDDNPLLTAIIMGIFYVFSNNIIMLFCTNKKKYDNFIMAIIVNLVIIGSYTLKHFNSILGNVMEIIMIIAYVIINLIQNNFKNKLENILVPIIFYVILNLWQFTILIVRGVEGLDLSNLPSLIYITMMLDYYIFLVITWIGGSFMGLLSMGWFFSKDITVLKAEKEKELAKKTPDMSEIAKIDARISEIEKEGR